MCSALPCRPPDEARVWRWPVGHSVNPDYVGGNKSSVDVGAEVGVHTSGAAVALRPCLHDWEDHDNELYALGPQHCSETCQLCIASRTRIESVADFCNLSREWARPKSVVLQFWSAFLSKSGVSIGHPRVEKRGLAPRAPLEVTQCQHCQVRFRRRRT